MCLVEVENSPSGDRLHAVVGRGHGGADRIGRRSCRPGKSMLEFVLTKPPSRLPRVDKGGDVRTAGPDLPLRRGESRFLETKQHVPEKQWSPVVYYDGPRCILCYAACASARRAWAWGRWPDQRGAGNEIAPNMGDHLECDECGMCIDICPVGALTSQRYRYKTRPWEMKHVGTAAPTAPTDAPPRSAFSTTASFAATTATAPHQQRIPLHQGRYGFDFAAHPERLQSPLMRMDGKLEEVSWAKALAAVAARFKEIKSRGGKFGVIGSTRTRTRRTCISEVRAGGTRR